MPSPTIHPLRPRDHEDAARICIRWLEDRHRKGWRNAFGELFDLWRPDDAGAENALDDDGITMLSINVGEWLIARGEIHARGGLRDINAYLIGRDGPYLTPGQQRWIAQLRERPLRLYRVTGVRPGAGLTLVDEFDADVPPLEVREISGSRSATPGMLMGARVMAVGEPPHEHLELSGAIYPFTKLHEPAALAAVRDALEGSAALALHQDNQRDLAEREIARCWLAQWLAPAPRPQLRDAGTGEPMLLVTDHYRVLDAAALAAALAKEADVSGDAEHGWVRGTDIGGGAMRSLAAINPGQAADRISVFYRTQGLADSGRAWFERVTAGAVRHLTREIVDPTSVIGRPDPGLGAGSAAPDLPPEVLAQAIEQVMHRHYAHWCDEPIPALADQTPRQAIATPSGLERVKGLLREYEAGEAHQAAAQGRRAVSYRFLWDALGIAP
ncbi:hypothetical protein [Sphaerotilus sp.]|uniref:hypothetical protein n=1 Tax=Sphaerotilus sp. TaxID=2093942 RepID=UPI002ACDD14D|nr:hypothetical protein [Sphaerotilus sp.]MDZ7855840.1 hypothetical protein [Sphaerotilus sp.]